MNKFNENKGKLNARLEEARRFDRYVFTHFDESLDDDHYYENQVIETYKTIYQTLKSCWDLDVPEFNDNSRSDLANLLANLMEKFREKLQENNTDKEYLKDAFGALNNILSNHDAQLQELFHEFKNIARRQRREELIQTITSPFKRLINYTRMLITNLYHHITLNAQINRGVQFQNIEQSTHLPFVQRSVTNSLNKLDKRNPKPKDKAREEQHRYEKGIIHEIEEHIKKMELPSNQKNYAFETLFTAKYNRAIELHSNRTILNTLITLWTAAKDQAAYGEEDTKEDLQNRLNHIIRHMALANREYNMDANGVDDGAPVSRPACLGGTVNKIVEALDLIHPDVRIIRGLEFVADLALDTFKQEFQNLTEEEQIALYKNQNSTEIRGRLNEKVKERINEIKTIFDGVIGEGEQNRLNQIIQEFEKNLEYLNIPDTPAIIKYKATQEKSEARPAPITGPHSSSIDFKPITIGGEEITVDQSKAIVDAFKRLRDNKGLARLDEKMLLNLAIKSELPEAFWDKNTNLSDLANALFAQMNETKPQQPSITAMSLMKPSRGLKNVEDNATTPHGSFKK